MSFENDEETKEIIDTALALRPQERSTYLDEVCAGNPDLRNRIEHHVSMRQETVAIEAEDREGDELEGTAQWIGPYKLIRKLGHGGMGSVYLAMRSDEQFQRQVAIKVIRKGMNTEGIILRFRRERQILASLDHPNVGRLFDGGATEDGLPYFVMQYIQGLPINRYCDNHKLSILERLKLFRLVCSAVHYAHQNLVVHRDIKPSNILVTTDGVPKLLDFGIAKLLNPEMISETQELTATDVRVMTPECASPEQVRGEQITTASDVYSLGVVLYELLTGRSPYRFTVRGP